MIHLIVNDAQKTHPLIEWFSLSNCGKDMILDAYYAFSIHAPFH
jgi:hypothetical protein